MDNWFIDLMTDIFGGVIERILLLVGAYYAGKYSNATFEASSAVFRTIRRWPKGPESWSWLIVLPVFLGVLAYTIVFNSFWAISVAALLLALHAEASLPGVVNIRASHTLSNVIVTAKLEVVSPPWFTVNGKVIPNPKYALRRALGRFNRVKGFKVRFVE